MSHKDTITLVTIIDDDKPGFLSFGEKKNSIKHIATEEVCSVPVIRTNGSDGRITCHYRTVQLTNTTSNRIAEPGKDYEHVEGKLTFEHNENS